MRIFLHILKYMCIVLYILWRSTMSLAQEERRRKSWESHGKAAFDARIAELRNLKKQIEGLPVDSLERTELQKKYEDMYTAVFKAYDKATDF